MFKNMSFIPPSSGAPKFTCPHCAAVSKQEWIGLTWDGETVYFQHQKCVASFGKCDHCEEHTVWVGETQVFPDVTNAPAPNLDLSQSIKDIYLEAASISAKSPRGAAALLRLAVQMLCKELGEPGKNINSDIASLVDKGLPRRVQQSLDCVRVIGNNAVHPGQIDADDPNVVGQLFHLVNIIAEAMISMPKRVDGIYSSLPPQDRNNIEKRDK